MRRARHVFLTRSTIQSVSLFRIYRVQFSIESFGVRRCEAPFKFFKFVFFSFHFINLFIRIILCGLNYISVLSISLNYFWKVFFVYTLMFLMITYCEKWGLYKMDMKLKWNIWKKVLDFGLWGASLWWVPKPKSQRTDLGFGIIFSLKLRLVFPILNFILSPKPPF